MDIEKFVAKLRTFSLFCACRRLELNYFCCLVQRWKFSLFSIYHNLLRLETFPFDFEGTLRRNCFIQVFDGCLDKSSLF